MLLPLLSRFSRVRLLATPWTAAYQAPPSMGFSRQEYWSGVPLPSPHLPLVIAIIHNNINFQYLEVKINSAIPHWRRKRQPTPVFLPGESQGWGSLMGCHLWGRTESDTTEAT